MLSIVFDRNPLFKRQRAKDISSRFEQLNPENIHRSVGVINHGMVPESVITPTVSIIMGAYNAAETLHECVNSILAQEFTDWELIICDDGSSDDTLRICKKYAADHPDRFLILTNERNLKLAATLNRCLAVARGKYIARMDADDISTPDRLTRQVAILDSQSDVDLVGTAMQRFDETGMHSLVVPPERPDRNTLRRSVPFCHATVLARRAVFEQTGGYSEASRAERVEDVDLWFRFYSQGFVGINLSEPLYLVREDADAFRRRTVRARLNGFKTTIIGYRQLGYPAHCYLHPVRQLSKALVPTTVQRWYRHWQESPSRIVTR